MLAEKTSFSIFRMARLLQPMGDLVEAACPDGETSRPSLCRYRCIPAASGSPCAATRSSSLHIHFTVVGPGHTVLPRSQSGISRKSGAQGRSAARTNEAAGSEPIF
jgi:hypothetical protein